MLEFLRHRRCPKENPPLETHCYSMNFLTLLHLIIPIVTSSLGTSPIRHLYVYQAQAAFTAYCAVIQK